MIISLPTSGRSQRWWLLLPAITALTGSVAFSTDPATHSETRPVLAGPSASSSDPDPSSSGVLRSRKVQVNFDRLNKFTDRGYEAMELDLFDDANFRGTVEHREDFGPGNYALVGSLAGVPWGNFILVVNDGVLVGNVEVPGETAYRIRPGAGGLHLIEMIDETLMGECGTDRLPETEAVYGSSAWSAELCSSNDDGATIDLMVMYTAAARQAMGGHAAIQAEIQGDVQKANTVYTDSLVNPRLRLVHMGEVVYDEDGTISEHRDRLVDPSDKIMDGIHALRDAYGADVVGLYFDGQNDWICDGSSDNPGAACDTDADCPSGQCRRSFTGLARTMLDLGHYQENQAFFVGYWGSSNTLLVHEIGHTEGCAHDRDNPQRGGLYDFSWGRRFLGTSGGVDGVCVNAGVAGDACASDADCPEGVRCIEYRTMMAYAPGRRIPFFTNPDVDYDGVPTGIETGQPDEAHNARTINLTADVVSNFRASFYWVDFAYQAPEQYGCFSTPFDNLVSALEAVPFGGMLRIKAGSTGEPITITKSSRLESWNGSAVIGAAPP